MPAALAQGELERRLLEIGFVEGAEVEILHEGMIGRLRRGGRVIAVVLRCIGARSARLRRTPPSLRDRGDQNRWALVSPVRNAHGGVRPKDGRGPRGRAEYAAAPLAEIGQEVTVV
jgi:Fe2+ transport system protein FeoA